jgi:GNAT superfamily N-acetyltransferase
MEYQYEYSNRIALPWVVENMGQFLYPDLSKKQDRIQKLMCGVVASLDKRPVGLILATFGATKEDARIHSFRVDPSHQNKGVGRMLLSTLEKNLRGEGCNKVDGAFRQHWKSAPALRKILEQNNWTTPDEELIIVKGEAKNVLKLFMDDRLSLPEGFRFKPFSGLSEDDLAYIRKRKAEDDWYPDILDPFIYSETINPITSLALMHNDTVVGWVMSHQISPTLNEFTSLFIDEGVRTYKLAHLLMRETIHRQHDHGIPEFLITAQRTNSLMSRFLIRHHEETGVFFTKTYRSQKSL